MKLLQQSNGNLVRTEQEKDRMIEEATIAYGDFLTALGFDWQSDENSKNTPYRVSKAWVEDLISGTNTEKPKITTFPTEYTGIVFEGGIKVISLCSHHNLAFSGTAYVAYIPDGQVIGLSKLNRIVDWYSRRPQIQEGLTQQVLEDLSQTIGDNKGVMVVIEAKHTCCSHRGIGHDSSMTTALCSGLFLQNDSGCKDEFYKMLDNSKK